MIAKRLAAVACACVMVFSLAGCSGNDASQQSSAEESRVASFNDVTDDQLSNAYYLMASQMPEETSMTGLYITGNVENKTISGTFYTTSEDGKQSEVAAEAESLMRLYSKAVAQAALQDAEDAEDEEAISKWQALVDTEESNVNATSNAEANSSGNAGGLYEYFTAIVTVQNDDNTLLVDGERAAGADMKWNWQ